MSLFSSTVGAWIRSVVDDWNGTGLTRNTSTDTRRARLKAGAQTLGWWCAVIAAIAIGAIGLWAWPAVIGGDGSGGDPKLWALDATIHASVDALVGPLNHEDAARLFVEKLAFLKTILADTASWPTRHRFLRHVGERVKTLADVLTAMNLHEPAELINRASLALDDVDDLPWASDEDLRSAVTAAMGHFEQVDCDDDTDIFSVRDCLLNFRNVDALANHVVGLWKARDDALKRLNTSTGLLTAMHLDLWTSALEGHVRSLVLAHLPWIPESVMNLVLPACSHAFFGPATMHAVLASRVIYHHYHVWQEERTPDNQEVRVFPQVTPLTFIRALLSGHGLGYFPLLLQLWLMYELNAYFGIFPFLRMSWLDKKLDDYLKDAAGYDRWVFVAAFVRGVVDLINGVVRLSVGLFVLVNVLSVCGTALAQRENAGEAIRYMSTWDFRPSIVLGLVWLVLRLARRVSRIVVRDDGATGTWLTWVGAIILNVALYLANTAARFGWIQVALPRLLLMNNQEGLDESLHAWLLNLSIPLECIFHGRC